MLFRKINWDRKNERSFIVKTTKRLLACVLALAMLLVCCPVFTAQAATTNADGYIEVRTVEDLYNIRNDLTANYILMNDIDLTAATAKGGDWDFMGNGWNPIGSGDIYGNNEFSGKFNGNGHTISGLRIELVNVPDGMTSVPYVGLFSSVSGHIYDLKVVGGSISANYNVYTDHTDNYSGRIGSIAGKCSGTLTDVHVDNYVEGQWSYAIGGLVGELATGGLVDLCSNQGEIKSRENSYKYYSYVGGIAGVVRQGIVSKTYNSGLILGIYSSNQCPYVGGIAGWINGTSSTQASIKDSYNAGNVVIYRSSTSEYLIGELYRNGIAYLGSYATITNCYNSAIAYYGIGYNNHSSVTISSAYYISGGVNSNGATSLTASQMKIQSMYAGFDFENTWIMSPTANYPYPQLRSNPQDLTEKVDYVTVVAWPNKMEYYVGEELDLTGCEVLVEYASGEMEFITPTADMLSGYNMNTLGSQTVTVTVNGVSDSFEITVVERPAVTSLELVSGPDRTTFTIATSFDFTGAVVKATYADGSTEIVPVTMDMTSGGNIRKLGTQTITVTYREQTTTFTVTVVTKTTAMSGTVAIVGDGTYGSTLTMDTSKVMPEAATYTCTWYVDGTAVSTAKTYTVVAADVGKNITVTLTASGNYSGSVTSAAVTAQKAQGQSVAAPTVIEVSETSVILSEMFLCEYSMDGQTWQDSPVFEGLTDGTTYTFYQRMMELNTNYAGPVSAPLVVTTLKAPEGPKTDAAFKFAGASLSLQHNLAINFKADKALFEDGLYTDPYVVFEMNGATSTVTDYTVSGNRYVFAFKNIAPNRMNDVVSATMYATRDGDLYATQTRTYSVAEYCYSMLELYSADQYAELRTLLVDLLNYGAASQWYTGHNVSNLVNEKLTDAQKQWATAETPELGSVLNTAYETVENPKATWRGAGLQLNEAVSVRLSFRAENTEGMKVVVKTAKQQWTLTSDKFVENNGTYYVYFNGLHAGQMRETFYITIYEGDTAVSNTASYSIESYAQQKADGDDFDLADLVVAMMKYGDSAYAYIN